MSFNNRNEESHKYGHLEGPQSQPTVGDGHLAREWNEQPRLGFVRSLSPGQQLPGNNYDASYQQTDRWIKKEFPDENDPQIKSWNWLHPLTVKQEPGIRHGAQIKKEQVFIDLTEEKHPEPPKRLMPGPKLLKAMYQYQQDEKVKNKPDAQPAESLFVQDDEESSGSVSSNPGEGCLSESSGDDTSDFMEIQKQFTSLISPSIEQQIEFEKQKQVELDRRRKTKIDKLFNNDTQMASAIEPENESIPYDQECVNEVSELEETQATDQPDMVTVAEKFAAAKRKDTRLTKARIAKARKVALDALLSKSEARKKWKSNKSQPESAKKLSRKGKATCQESHTFLSDKEIRSIFENNSGYQDANKRLPPGFVSTEKNKRKAFAEMIASIPTEGKAEARADRAILDEATKTFNPSARPDGEGKWKVRGLKTSLMANQVLAASWMCKRETCNSKPDGGLLCDVMGFGKTLSTLACIVNRKLPREPEGPTLIVAPRSLMITWLSQIQEHCERNAAGRPIGHYSGAHVATDDLICEFKNHGIVVTTYSEICSSYPAMKPPSHLNTYEALEDWWENFYDDEAGAFHQMHWHRIILDEAHIIKNRHTQTSIAVRALSANFKWALTGTPLHNCIAEFYPLFAFVGVSNSDPYRLFEHNYCNGTQDAKNRLINVLRAIIHRKSHESRHMGRPIIELKKFDMRTVEIRFYPAEKLIYRAVAEQFIKKINATQMRIQNKCILTMILKLQMFSSHPLAAEDYLKRVCKSDGPLYPQLMRWVKDETSPGIPSPSSMIAKCCLLEEQPSHMPLNAPNTQTESESLRPRPPGDCTKLVSNFRAEIERLFQLGHIYACDRRTWFCPSCEGLPTGAIITSCNHLYCEECFDALGDKEGNTDDVFRICHECKITIQEAAFYGIYDGIDEAPLDESESSSDPPTGQPKRKASRQKNSTQKRRKVERSSIPFTEWMTGENLVLSDDDNSNESQAEGRSEVEDSHETESAYESEDPSKDKEYSTSDWIAAFGRSMPGAKFDQITAEITKWFEEDKTTKVVIFTQYINSTKILQYLCEKNDWEHAKITGKMANRSREIQLQKFREDPDTKIMITSIKTGGLGLDFSVANKCILVDLWWNEAVQEQAFFRLWRLGQKRDVECIILVIKESIDDWMLRIQKGKSEEISQVMSHKVLADRNTLRELLEMFGEVTDDPERGFNVNFDSKAEPRAKSKATRKVASKVKASRTRSSKK